MFIEQLDSIQSLSTFRIYWLKIVTIVIDEVVNIRSPCSVFTLNNISHKNTQFDRKYFSVLFLYHSNPKPIRMYVSTVLKVFQKGLYNTFRSFVWRNTVGIIWRTLIFGSIKLKSNKLEYNLFLIMSSENRMQMKALNYFWIFPIENRHSKCFVSIFIFLLSTVWWR